MLGSILSFLISPLYLIYEKYLEREVKEGSVPSHLAVILDGNRRFAIEKGLKEVNMGHEMGAKRVKDFLRWCLDLDIKKITLFAFSTENFNRPKKEVDRLMELIEEKMYEFAEDITVHERNVRIKAIGRLSMLPERTLSAIRKAEEATAGYDAHFLYVALAYGGRAELIDAIRKILMEVKMGVLDPHDISEELINRNLYADDHQFPEVIIRTSGEKRLSNFLLWQSDNAYLCFIDVYWPGIRKIDLLRGIRTYQRRKVLLEGD